MMDESIQNGRARGNQKGFSLIELSAALFILTVGLFGVIQMYHFGLDKLNAVREFTLATQAIQNEIETLRTMPFSSLENGERQGFIAAVPELETLVQVSPTVSIRDFIEGRGEVKEVTVRIKWIGEHGRVIEKSLTTLIADKGRG